MGDSSQFPLRPLGIGEIFDRAVTVYVRHFVTFTLIVMTLVVPLGVVRYYLFSSLGYNTIFAGTTKSVPPQDIGGVLAGAGLILLLALILAPIVNNAVAVGVASLYTGQAPSYAASFRAVLGRWGQLFGAAILLALVFLGLYFGAVIMFMIVIGIGAALVSAFLPLAIVLYVVAAILGLALVLFFVMVALAGAFALYSTSIEQLGSATAVSTAFARIFSRTEFKKSLLMALAFLGIELGVYLVTAGIALALGFWLKSYPLMVSIETILNALFAAFIAILLAVYYYDVRTRAEGLDIEVDLSRLVADGTKGVS